MGTFLKFGQFHMEWPIKWFSQISFDFYSRLKPKIVYYRNYKNFKKYKFPKNLSNNTLFLDSDDPNEN